MKIAVINGSPKGKYSITLQTLLYLQRKYPEHEFAVLHAGQKIKALEKDFSEARALLSSSDAVLFSYPVYTFLCPSQLHRFIELLKESGVDLSGKGAAQITTSKHFYDTTAHAYIRENCADLGLSWLGTLSADMDDLTKPEGQKEARDFWDLVLWRAEEGIAEPVFLPEKRPVPAYTRIYDLFDDMPKMDGKNVTIVADLREGDDSLAAMIEDFRARFPYESRLVNIAEYPFSGGCLGCFGCAADGKCIYRDGFDTFLREEIQSADAIVYAFTIRDHSMGARMKMYDDRQFCNGHRTVTMGSPTAYLIHGDLAAEANLRTVIEGRADVGRNFLAGIATDSGNLGTVADSLVYALENRVSLPQTTLRKPELKETRVPQCSSQHCL